MFIAIFTRDWFTCFLDVIVYFLFIAKGFAIYIYGGGGGGGVGGGIGGGGGGCGGGCCGGCGGGGGCCLVVVAVVMTAFVRVAVVLVVEVQ